LQPKIDIAFVLLAALASGAGIAAISLRNLIHCALCFATSLLGIAGLFLWLGAQFVGFAQILVYVGAISILVVFAILLTRNAGHENGQRFFGSPLVSAMVSILVGGVLISAIAVSGISPSANPGEALQVTPTGYVHTQVMLVGGANVLNIGAKLMTSHVLALEIIALMLTAALLGAVTLAMPERKRS
jgi:NADH-quinone oxidoreductase subunit J